ncbi:MAG: hypothetical protein ACFFCQ_09200 [Promethearchaeota archaeon]
MYKYTIEYGVGNYLFELASFHTKDERDNAHYPIGRMLAAFERHGNLSIHMNLVDTDYKCCDKCGVKLIQIRGTHSKSVAKNYKYQDDKLFCEECAKENLVCEI